MRDIDFQFPRPASTDRNYLDNERQRLRGGSGTQAQIVPDGVKRKDNSTQLRAEKTSKPPKRAFHISFHFVLAGLAMIVLGLGLLVEVQTIITNHSVKAEVNALGSPSSSAASPSQSHPSESAVNSYSVAPGLPKKIVIPKLNINARILQVGVNAKNELGVPPNIFDTAWYTGSARPGDAPNQGAILIDGHVHGPTLPGVFYRLSSLVPGDTIQVQRGDNTWFNYVVEKESNYTLGAINVSQLLTSIDPAKPGLNLITCGGPFDVKAWQYTERTVVYAAQT